MSKTVGIQYDHGCTADKCYATRHRCPTDDCGQLEHTRPAELDPQCLIHDLTVSYVEGAWCGPGLVTLIVDALGRPSAGRRDDSEGGRSGKPGSRPPGWNADASALLADIRTRGASVDRDTLEDWRRQARTILGFTIPSIALPRSGCFVCGQPTLRVACDASSDVWCSNSMCHDSERWDWCVYIDDLGYPDQYGYGTPGSGHWSCRRTDKALTHAARWRRDSWGGVLRQMQDANDAANPELQAV